MGHSRAKRRPGQFVAASLALALGLAACGGGGTDEEVEPLDQAEGTEGDPQQGGVVTVDWVADPASLDPLKYNSFASFNIVRLVYNTLYRWTDDGGLEPELASDELEISEDGLSVSIPIRSGVKFHDGTDLTADDVAFTIESVLDPENGSTWFAGLSPVTEVSAPDDSTVELTLSRPHSALAGMLAQVPIMSSDEEYLPTETYAQKMNGTGAFKFVEWNQGVEVVLEKNDDYHVEGLPYLDGVVFRVTAEDASRMANVTNGDADIMPMVPFDLVETLESRDVNVDVAPDSALLPLLFPSTKEGRPTANADFRRALAWAIDRGTLVDTVFKDQAEPSSTILTKGTPYWDEELGTTYGDTADLTEAKAALAESGVEPGTSIELVVRNEPLYIAMGTVIQANLKELGLDVSLSPEEAASYLPNLLSGDFDIMLLSLEIGLASGFTPVYMYSAVHSDSGANYTSFSDEELDALLVEASGNPDDPAAAWRAVQERDLELVPLIPTVSARYVEAYSDRLRGHKASPLFSLRDLDRTWIEE